MLFLSGFTTAMNELSLKLRPMWLDAYVERQFHCRSLYVTRLAGGLRWYKVTLEGAVELTGLA